MKADEVKNSIIESFRENNNPHAFLVCTNNLDKSYRDICEITRIINSLYMMTTTLIKDLKLNHGLDLMLILHKVFG